MVCVTLSFMPVAMTTKNRRRAFVVGLMRSAGWPLPRLYHRWPLRIVEESLGFMVTLFFIFMSLRNFSISFAGIEVARYGFICDVSEHWTKIVASKS